MNSAIKRAFTLVELLVVVAIIALLLAILVPTLHRARTQAKKAQVASQIQLIATALHAFSNDQGDFPTSDPFSNDGTVDPCYVPTGAHLLAVALVGTPSGNNPLGNKKPYLGADKAGAVPDYDRVENWGAFADITVAPYGGRGNYILMDHAFKSPILYYKANRRAKFQADLTAYLAVADERKSSYTFQAAYYFADNYLITGPSPRAPFGWNGCGKATFTQGQTANGSFADLIEIKGTRTVPENCLSARVQNSEEFLLISAGPDGVFGFQGQEGKCDDIANFTVPQKWSQ